MPVTSLTQFNITYNMLKAWKCVTLNRVKPCENSEAIILALDD